jgi:hypothetical protein
MARESGIKYDLDGVWCDVDQFKAFEALVRADEREIVMNEPLTKAQWQRFEDEIRADERDEILRMSGSQWFKSQARYDEAIRNRGNA